MTITEPPAIKVTHKNTLFTIIYRQGDRRTNHKPKYKHGNREHVGVKGTGGGSLI